MQWHINQEWKQDKKITEYYGEIKNIISKLDQHTWIDCDAELTITQTHYTNQNQWKKNNNMSLKELFLENNSK